MTAVVEMPTGTDLNDYRVHMTSLPFEMVEKGKRIKAQLNPSELRYYITPTVNLSPKPKPYQITITQ
jgi:hypothetical protein